MKIETKEVKTVVISDYNIFENEEHKYNVFATEWFNGDGMDVTLEGDGTQTISLSFEDIKAINEAAKQLDLI